MSSIIRYGEDTFHGISVSGRGVFTNDEDEDDTKTYAGQIRNGHACGLGVLTCTGGTTVYAELGPDGWCDGRFLSRWAEGDTYNLHDEVEDRAFVSADGRCNYNYEACARDDPRLVALIAQVAPIEVRPAAPAPLPPTLHHSPPSHRPMDRPARFAFSPAGAGDRRGHRGAPPFRTPSLVVARHNPTAATLPRTTTQ
jgi:hypothetical protein